MTNQLGYMTKFIGHYIKRCRRRTVLVGVAEWWMSWEAVGDGGRQVSGKQGRGVYLFKFLYLYLFVDEQTN